MPSCDGTVQAVPAPIIPGRIIPGRVVRSLISSRRELLPEPRLLPRRFLGVGAPRLRSAPFLKSSDRTRAQVAKHDALKRHLRTRFRPRPSSQLTLCQVLEISTERPWPLKGRPIFAHPRRRSSDALIRNRIVLLPAKACGRRFSYRAQSSAGENRHSTLRT
jgi:hypothetical protein